MNKKIWIGYIFYWSIIEWKHDNLYEITGCNISRPHHYSSNDVIVSTSIKHEIKPNSNQCNKQMQAEEDIGSFLTNCTWWHGGHTCPFTTRVLFKGVPHNPALITSIGRCIETLKRVTYMDFFHQTVIVKVQVWEES